MDDQEDPDARRWVFDREEWDEWYLNNQDEVIYQDHIPTPISQVHSRVKRQTNVRPGKEFDPKEVIPAFHEFITPLMVWTVIIFWLVCMVLPLLFTTEYLACRPKRKAKKVYPETTSETELPADDGDRDCFDQILYPNQSNKELIDVQALFEPKEVVEEEPSEEQRHHECIPYIPTYPPPLKVNVGVQTDISNVPTNYHRTVRQPCVPPPDNSKKEKVTDATQTDANAKSKQRLQQPVSPSSNAQSEELRQHSRTGGQRDIAECIPQVPRNPPPKKHCIEVQTDISNLPKNNTSGMSQASKSRTVSQPKSKSVSYVKRPPPEEDCYEESALNAHDSRYPPSSYNDEVNDDDDDEVTESALSKNVKFEPQPVVPTSSKKSREKTKETEKVLPGEQNKGTDKVLKGDATRFKSAPPREPTDLEDDTCCDLCEEDSSENKSAKKLKDLTLVELLQYAQADGGWYQGENQEEEDCSVPPPPQEEDCEIEEDTTQKSVKKKNNNDDQEC